MQLRQQIGFCSPKTELREGEGRLGKVTWGSEQLAKNQGPGSVPRENGKAPVPAWQCTGCQDGLGKGDAQRFPEGTDVGCCYERL